MRVKLFEIRDRATCLSALAIVPGFPDNPDPETRAQWRYHLGRCGYDWRDNSAPPEPPRERQVLLGDMNGRKPFHVDPYDWGDRTWQAAHLHIEEHFDTLPDGAVIDVRVLLGETSEPAKPDRGDRFGDRS